MCQEHAIVHGLLPNWKFWLIQSGHMHLIRHNKKEENLIYIYTIYEER